VFRSRARRLAFLLVSSLLLTKAWQEAQCAGPRFFTITLSNGGRTSYLYGERVFAEVEVRNETDRPLTYLATGDGDGAFIDKVYLHLTRHGQPVPRETDAPVFRGAPSLHESLLRRLPPGGSLKCIRPLDNLCHLLPPGNYTMWAVLRQRCGMYGLTTGEAVSNRLRFTVKEWTPKAYVEKVWKHKLGHCVWRETVRIVETTEGKSLVCWKSEWAVEGSALTKPKDTSKVMFRAVPIEGSPRLESVFWSATEDECRIVCEESRRRRLVLLIVKRADSSVTLTELRSSGMVRQAGAGGSLWPLAIMTGGGLAYLILCLSRRSPFRAPMFPTKSNAPRNRSREFVPGAAGSTRPSRANPGHAKPAPVPTLMRCGAAVRGPHAQSQRGARRCST